MAGYLSVTDDSKLTPQGVAVLAKEFPRRSEVNPTALPTYSGTGTKAHSWVAPFYNRESKKTSTFRGMIADAIYSGVDKNIVCIGDSKTNGSGPNTGTAYLDAYPSVLRRMLGAVDGLVTAEPGGAQWDNRWTSTGMRAPYGNDQIGVVPVNGATGPFLVGFSPGFNHTGATFWVNAASGATLTVTVDGGAAQTVTVASGNGFKAVTPVVTGDSAHTYQISSPTGFHLSVFQPTYSTPKLKVTRLGKGGSAAADWAPGFRADGTGLWDTLLLAGANALMVGLGTNDASAAAVTALYASTAGLGVPVLAIAPGGLGGTGGLRPLADYIPIYTAIWAAADQYDLPMVDFESIIGDWPTANTDGLMGDSVHESRRGYAYEAAAVKSLFS